MLINFVSLREKRKRYHWRKGSERNPFFTFITGLLLEKRKWDSDECHFLTLLEKLQSFIDSAILSGLREGRTEMERVEMKRGGDGKRWRWKEVLECL